MLIKLAGGVKADLSELKLEVGAKFLRYLASGAYDKGEVIEIENEIVVVDFMDSVRSFPQEEVTLVYGRGDEHLMFCGEGTLLKKFEGTNHREPASLDLEDLLDFDKWMV